MKAVVHDRFGDESVLAVKDLPDPPPRPDEVGDEVAACLPVAAGSAVQAAATRAGLQRGQTLLVNGASGGVGAAGAAGRAGAAHRATGALAGVARAQADLKAGRVHGKVCVRVADA